MDWIWSEWFWVPPGVTWEDYKSRDGIQTPDFNDLLFWPFFSMIVLLVLRKIIIVPLVFAPFGRYMGLRSKPISPPPPNPKLEKLYKVNRARPPQNLLERCAKENNMAERQVERWLRRQALSQQKTTLEKFSDLGWEFTYYTCYCIFGLLVVATQSWCYNLDLSVENYPRIPISQGLWWYFRIGFGFYLSQTYTLLTGTKRFDFYLMLLHHVCTLPLMTFCWLINFVRLGALTLLVHECVDITLANLMSIPFCLVWFPARLVIYPFHVLRGTLFVAPRVVGKIFPAYYLLNSLMISLLVMHVVWSYEIIKAIIIKMERGVHLNDRFSPDELSEEDNLQQSETLSKEGNLTQNSIQRHNGILTQNGALTQKNKPD